MVVGVQDEKEKILNTNECYKRKNDRPAGYKGEFFGNGESRIGIAAGHLLIEYCYVEVRQQTGTPLNS